MGAQIGNLRVVSPTCADDIAILACSKHEAQALLEIALILTDKDLVRINPTKTDLVQRFNVSKCVIQDFDSIQNMWDHISFPDLV
jgi:tetraacyldisaccharide-1-P 4'-kinase